MAPRPAACYACEDADSPCEGGQPCHDCLVQGTANTCRPISFADEKYCQYFTRTSETLGKVPGAFQLAALPRDFHLTTMEILVFFPGMLNDAGFVYHIERNRWLCRDVTHALNFGRDWGQGEMCSLSVVRNTMNRTMKQIEMVGTAYTETAWQRERNQHGYSDQWTTKEFAAVHLAAPKDVTLASLANNVKVWPVGPSRGTLTQVLERFKDGYEVPLELPLFIFETYPISGIRELVKAFELQEEEVTLLKDEEAREYQREVWREYPVEMWNSSSTSKEMRDKWKATESGAEGLGDGNGGGVV